MGDMLTSYLSVQQTHVVHRVVVAVDVRAVEPAGRPVRLGALEHARELVGIDLRPMSLDVPFGVLAIVR
jgi:hypothetical protein